jgi:hypothetical protein
MQLEENYGFIDVAPFKAYVVVPYMYQLLLQPIPVFFFAENVFVCFIWFSVQTAIILLIRVNQLVLEIETRCVFLEVRSEFLNIEMNVILQQVYERMRSLSSL